MLAHKLVVSHRGLSGPETENTLKAFAASVARGVEAVEFDVRQTGDGVIVLSHDSTAGGRLVSRSTYAELAASMPALCTLAEVLETIPAECLVDVEVKVLGAEEDILRELKLRREVSEFVVTSFHDEVVARVQALDPGVRVGLVLGKHRPEDWWRTRLSELFPSRRLKSSTADFVVLRQTLVRFGTLRRIARQGYPIWVWTVNHPRRLRWMFASPDVEAVITDLPLEAMALRGRAG